MCPITAPSIIEIIAEKFGGKVVRTKTSPQAVMEQMLNHNLFKNKKDMNQFLLNFDALAGLVKIIEYLCTEEYNFDRFLRGNPRILFKQEKDILSMGIKGACYENPYN